MLVPAGSFLVLPHNRNQAQGHGLDGCSPEQGKFPPARAAAGSGALLGNHPSRTPASSSQAAACAGKQGRGSLNASQDLLWSFTSTSRDRILQLPHTGCSLGFKATLLRLKGSLVHQGSHGHRVTRARAPWQHHWVPCACVTLLPPCLGHAAFCQGKSLILQSSLSLEGHRAHTVTSPTVTEPASTFQRQQSVTQALNKWRFK